ncbi:MAG TPA: DUF1206 domain-containing protein [Thermoanaerobaculia bacterium]
MARFGYAAKGVVYVVVGGLALQAALGGGGGTTGGEGALRAIAGQPFGQVLLWLLALGLVGYALWRFVQGVLDVEDRGTDAEGLAVRGGFLASGAVHGLLAVYAFGLVTGNGGGGGGGAQGATAKVLAHPFGAWLVGLAGVAVIGYGLVAAHRAYTRKYRQEVAFGRLDRRVQRGIDRAGRLGLAARAVVFGLIGVFLIRAAVQSNPAQARGLEGALDTLAAQPHGPWLLGVVAVGLMAYGVWSMVKARYRVFRT